MMTAPIATLVAIAAVAQLPNGPPTRVVFERRAQPGQWRCVTPEAATPQIIDRDVVRWPCNLTRVLQCDADGYEPVDIVRDSCGSEVAVVPQPARVFSLLVEGEHPLTIEWREWRVTGSRLLATRRMSPTPVRLSLPVSTAARIVRVYREGAAPVSFPIDRGGRVERALPPPEAGGEVLLNMGGTAIMPVSMDADGRSPLVARFGSAPFARASAFPGEYSVRLRFKSALTTDLHTVKVVAGATTELFRGSFSPFGAADVRLDTALAVDNEQLAIHQIVEDGTGSVTIPLWTSTASHGRSPWLVDGLPVGEYEAILRGGSEDITSTRFSVADATTSQVRLEAAKVKLFGCVMLGAAPAPAGTTIEFRVARRGASWKAQTDANGAFAVSLPEPGDYVARLLTTKYLSTWTDNISVKAGDNRFDWTIPGGALRISLRRNDGQRLQELVQLQIEAPGFHAAGPITTEEASESVLIPGLPLSSAFTVKADTASGLVSEPVTVELSSSKPIADVALTLREGTATLEVRGARGTPLAEAHVVAGNAVLEQDPPQSGAFKVRRTSPGTGMSITAPGYLPVCRIFKVQDVPASTVQLTNENLVPVTIRLTGARATRAVGYFLGLPGSDCPVMLADTAPGLLHDGNATIFTLRLPPGAYQYTPSARYPLQLLEVPGKALEIRVQPAK